MLDKFEFDTLLYDFQPYDNNNDFGTTFNSSLQNFEFDENLEEPGNF